MQHRYDCNCDLVIDMEELGVGVEEILQYAHAVLTSTETRDLLHGLGCILGGQAAEGGSGSKDVVDELTEVLS